LLNLKIIITIISITTITLAYGKTFGENQTQNPLSTIINGSIPINETKNNLVDNINTQLSKTYVDSLKFNFNFSLNAKNNSYINDLKSYFQSQNNDNSLMINTLAVIASSVLSSYLTFRYGKRIEDHKQKQSQLQEKIFFKKIIKLIVYELENHIELLSYLENVSTSKDRQNNNIKSIKEDYKEDIRLKLRNVPDQYLRISSETKIKLFSSEMWSKLEIAYRELHRFIEKTEQKLQQYDIHYQQNELEELKKILGETLDSLKKNYYS